MNEEREPGNEVKERGEKRKLRDGRVPFPALIRPFKPETVQRSQLIKQVHRRLISNSLNV